MRSRVEIIIKGIVQGVGFRPFVYNLAKRYRLFGYVLNNTSGVLIDVEGDPDSINAFVESIKRQPPRLAIIYEMNSQTAEPIGYADFVIRQSENEQEKFVPISPEIATCQECLQDIFDPANRRYRYPFTNCTNCGPRFTIVKDIPYDRKFTTMAPFVMCAHCREEYEDPENRRFHAQPNACPQCGPSLSLLDKQGMEIETPDVIQTACRLLQEGKILAIKGLGGYHLACDAMNREAVRALRSRKFREYKPFALMVRDIETARSLCTVNSDEERLLYGALRPIVLLQKRPDCPAAEEVAPNQKFHGIMVPYTPLHHLILSESNLVLIMTSGNISSEPIAYQDQEVVLRLRGIADYFVVHDREIYIRTDDSVSRVWKGEDSVLRRSRGYVPFPLQVSPDFAGQILACGAELKNTFCLTRGSFAFMSHHIGDLENLETFASFENGIEHFKRIFNIEPIAVAYDLHPEYLSTKYALSRECALKIGIQHHHAHIASCMGDNKISGKVIGISFDGTGYGTDGNIWGGEFLVCDDNNCRRAAHFEYMPLPGAEKAIREPWRMGACYLNRVFGESMLNLGIEFVQKLDRKKWRTVKRMIERRINSPMTSSAGRLFDAISALLGVRSEVYYEGQAAIELEMLAGEETESYSFGLEEVGDTHTIQVEPLIRGIVRDLADGVRTDAIAARFHNTMGAVILEVCLRIRKTTGLNRIVMSGGVFQNMRLLQRAFDLLERNNFRLYTHHRVPTNDGGIALGQAIIASARIRSGNV